MAIDWNAKVIGPLVAVFGENDPASPTDMRPLFTPQGGAAYRINAVFTDAYENKVLLDDGAPGFISHNPTLGIQDSALLAAAVPGDQVMIPRTGLTYLINEPQPDGQGHTLWQLNVKAS